MSTVGILDCGCSYNEETHEALDQCHACLVKAEKEIAEHCGKYACRECPVFSRCHVAKEIFG